MDQPHEHAPPADWPFPGPENEMAFTCVHVVRNRWPVLYVTHEASDHCWQFLCGGRHVESDVRVVCLGCTVAGDPSLRELADLPPGWSAERRRARDAWTRLPMAPESPE